MYFKKYPGRWWRYLLSAPVIYWMIFPLVMIDISIEVYHRLCFPLYGLPYARRGDYIRIDRHKLKYLHWIERINCAYCGYANGLAQYFVRIAGDTERYWCGIRHKKGGNFHEPNHHIGFLPYNDEKSFKEFLDSE